MLQLERVLITEEGLEKLKEELHQREDIKKRSLVDTLITSKESGDERENDGFSLAFEDYQINEQRILDIKDVIKYHQIIKPKQNKYIEIGHTVILKDSNDIQKSFQIVGEYEADPLNGKITFKSPLGKQLLNRKIGEMLKLNNELYTIIKVSI